MNKYRLDEHFTYKKLLHFVFPSVIMMVFTSLYSLVDGLFIARFAGSDAFAGINFIFPIIGILGAIGFMIGAGGSALIGKKLGEKEYDAANRYFSLFIYITPLISIILSVITYIFLPEIIVLLNGEGYMAEYALTYGRTSICFVTFFILQMEFQPLFVVAEKTNINTFLTLGCGAFNIVLDAIFILALNLGVNGAAIATGICQMIGSIFPIIYFARKNSSRLRLGKTTFMIKPIIKCIVNGSSEFIGNIATSVASIVFNFQLMNYAKADGVTAYGVYMYVSFIFSAIFFGYTLGVSPLISYNYGANDHKELRNIYYKSMVLTLFTSLIMTGLSYALCYPLSLAFGDNRKELIDLILRSFLFFSMIFLFRGACIFGSSFFTALNNGVVSLVLALVRTFVFPLIFIYILPLFMGSDGIWLSLTVAEFAALVVTVIFLYAYRNKYHFAREKGTSVMSECKK